MDSLATDAFLEPTFRRAFVIWWALFWRAILWAMALGAAVGIAEEFVGRIRYLSVIVGVIIDVSIGIYLVQRILRKYYREFSIRLVPTAGQKLASDYQPVPDRSP
jgi:hypothetical protein